MSLGLLLAGLWAASAFAPGAAARQLEQAMPRLPLAFAEEESSRLELVFHQDPSVPVAALVSTGANGRGQLALFAPLYLRGIELVALDDLTVDLSEPYFHALLEAYLWGRLQQPAGELDAEIRLRATTTMTDVPSAHRLEAYVDALASFGAHLLSVANELDRSEQRRRARGSSLCSLVGQPLPLFRLWERVLGDGGYPGSYVDTATGDEVRMSHGVLGGVDKRLLVERVLGVSWGGSAAVDLAPRLCARH